MTVRDGALAALAALMWGLAFVATRVGLDSFSPAQLTVLRFAIACVPAVLVPRPPLPWRSIAAIGLTLFTGQFLLLFFAFTRGLPPGVASVSQQMQAFFTVILAAAFLGDVPTRRQVAGMAVALAGLAVIASTSGGSLALGGLGLGLAAALSWAVGNVLVKRARPVPMLSLVVWCSLVPPLPALALSRLVDPGAGLFEALRQATWPSLGAAVYLGALATVLSYAIWGRLLQRYPSAAVAPFALLAPCAGVASSALILGESFSPLRWVGLAVTLAGVAVTALPARGTERPPASAAAPNAAGL